MKGIIKLKVTIKDINCIKRIKKGENFEKVRKKKEPKRKEEISMAKLSFHPKKEPLGPFVMLLGVTVYTYISVSYNHCALF